MATSNEYVFLTRWRIEGSIEEVSDILGDAEDLVRWWPSVYLQVHKDADGVVHLHTKGWLPYTLRIYPDRKGEWRNQLDDGLLWALGPR